MDIRSLIMGLVFALMWSSAFSSARIIVANAPPLGALSIRFLISGIIGVLIARWLGQTFQLTKAQWKATIIFGIFQNALYLGLNFFAMQTIEASLASIIASSMPLMVAFSGWIIFRERLSSLGALGLFLGFFGVTVIMAVRIEIGADIFGIVLCLLGAAALTIATLAVRGASAGGSVMMIVGLQMIVGSICLGSVSLVFEDMSVTWDWPFVLAFIYTMLVPGLLATFIWFKLVNRIGAVKAATFHFLNPFFGVLIANIILEEEISGRDFIGVLIITGGILAVQWSKQESR
ncbi:MAG: DMT family transporter [Paracoccaceae bacterium]|nr:DMT family transporter [Paracoccaceae bacterium]